MVLKQDLSASKTTTCHDTSKKTEQNQTATSLIGFSIGYKNRSNAQMAEHRAYVRKYLAEERNKKPILPSNKNTCPSNSSNATRTSLNGFSNGFVGAEFEYKRKNYIKDHFTDLQKYSKQYNPKFLEHRSHESPSPAEKNHGTSETKISSHDEASGNQVTVNSEENKTKKIASKHTTKVKSLTDNQRLYETSSSNALNSKRNAKNAKATKPFYEVRPGESSKNLPSIKSYCGKETEYSSSFGRCSVLKNNSISDVQKDMSKHKQDYLDRTQTESGYGFAKSSNSASKQQSTIMAMQRRATIEYRENRAKNNKSECPYVNDGMQAWHRDERDDRNERKISTGINEYNRGGLEKRYKNKNFIFG